LLLLSQPLVLLLQLQQMLLQLQAAVRGKFVLR